MHGRREDTGRHGLSGGLPNTPAGVNFFFFFSEKIAQLQKRVVLVQFVFFLFPPFFFSVSCRSIVLLQRMLVLLQKKILLLQIRLCDDAQKLMVLQQQLVLLPSQESLFGGNGHSVVD